ncbi:MAG: hypothetical protein CMA10_04605 [Euryarchaeota archaeon]|nr:hypothetical protein [Euryarchaeota archaeon]|tara:strand:- start:1844 stop:2668 length:825 start_codon:yes stop_codon:yes gene_type:complete
MANMAKLTPAGHAAGADNLFEIKLMDSVREVFFEGVTSLAMSAMKHATNTRGPLLRIFQEVCRGVVEWDEDTKKQESERIAGASPIMTLLAAAAAENKACQLGRRIKVEPPDTVAFISSVYLRLARSAYLSPANYIPARKEYNPRTVRREIDQAVRAAVSDLIDFGQLLKTRVRKPRTRPVQRISQQYLAAPSARRLMPDDEISDDGRSSVCGPPPSVCPTASPRPPSRAASVVPESVDLPSDDEDDAPPSQTCKVRISSDALRPSRHPPRSEV